MDKALDTFGAMILVVAGVAIVALLVSQKSQTSSVLSGAFSGFNSVLATALSPVTGGSSSSNQG